MRFIGISSIIFVDDEHGNDVYCEGEACQNHFDLSKAYWMISENGKPI